MKIEVCQLMSFVLSTKRLQSKLVLKPRASLTPESLLIIHLGFKTLIFSFPFKIFSWRGTVQFKNIFRGQNADFEI